MESIIGVLTTKDFVDTLNLIKEYNDFLVDFEKIFQCCLGRPVVAHLGSRLVEILNRAVRLPMNQTMETVINFFCWELDFGREYHKGDFFIDGEEYPLANVYDLVEVVQRLEEGYNVIKYDAFNY